MRDPSLSSSGVISKPHLFCRVDAQRRLHPTLHESAHFPSYLGVSSHTVTGTGYSRGFIFSQVTWRFSCISWRGAKKRAKIDEAHSASKQENDVTPSYARKLILSKRLAV